MSKEILIAEAVPVAKEAPANSVKTKRESRRNMVGKIARLPHSVREQLNFRLRDNERSAEILMWLNGLSRVKQILAEQFEGKAIDHRNLSHWRQGGFQIWMEKQESLEEVKALAAETKKLNKASGGELARGVGAGICRRTA